MAKKFEIRNSTAEFLTFVAEGKEQGVQVLYEAVRTKPYTLSDNCEPSFKSDLHWPIQLGKYDRNTFRFTTVMGIGSHRSFG